MRLDTERIKSDADAVDVASDIGIRIVRRGGHNFCECPEHQMNTGRKERKLDSCIISRYGYHCFSCGGKGDVFSLVMNHLGVSFYEAQKVVCETLGGVSMYILDDNGYNQVELPLNKEQLEALGLLRRVRSKSPMVLLSDKEEFKQHECKDFGDVSVFENGEKAYVGYTTSSYDLLELFVSEPYVFWELVKNKAQEMYTKYAVALQLDIAGKVLEPEHAYAVNMKYKRWMGICERIYQL